MGKKKSIVLMVLLTIVIVILCAITVVPSFSLSVLVKDSVKIWNPVVSKYDLGTDLDGGYYAYYYPTGVISEAEYKNLDKEDQDKIMGFLIEHSPYADAKLDEQIYILKSSRHENFYNMDNGSIQEANKAYNQIIDIMIDRENSLRKKYIAKK